MSEVQMVDPHDVVLTGIDGAIGEDFSLRDSPFCDLGDRENESGRQHRRRGSSLHPPSLMRWCRWRARGNILRRHDCRMRGQTE